METVRRIIIKRTDGAYCNLKFEPVKSMRAAARFHDVEDYEGFMAGYYKPPNPDDYTPQEIEITYREVEQYVQKERDDQQAGRSLG